MTSTAAGHASTNESFLFISPLSKEVELASPSSRTQMPVNKDRFPVPLIIFVVNLFVPLVSLQKSLLPSSSPLVDDKGALSTTWDPGSQGRSVPGSQAARNPARVHWAKRSSDQMHLGT